MVLKMLLVLATAGAAMADVVETSDGQRVDGKLVSIDATTAVVQAAGGRKALPLSGIAQITFAQPPADDAMARKGQHVLWISDGSRLAVSNVSIRSGRLRATSSLAGDLALPMEGLVRLLRPNAAETPEQLERDLRDVNPPAAREDAILVRSPAGKPIAMNGLLSSLDKGQIAFTYEGAETAMADESICAVLFASTKPATQPAAAGHVVGADGSRMMFHGVSGSGGALSVRSASLGTVKLPPQSVVAIRFQRHRAVYLSDLAPAESVHTPFFDDECPWQKDRSAAGQVLALDGRRYEKGLGLHARTRLTFDLDGRHARLSGMAGIDDDLRQGRALLSILGDGKPLLDPTLLDRAQPPARLDVPVAGVRKLTIIIDFAPDSFGGGSRASLCDLALSPVSVSAGRSAPTTTSTSSP